MTRRTKTKLGRIVYDFEKNEKGKIIKSRIQGYRAPIGRVRDREGNLVSIGQVVGEMPSIPQKNIKIRLPKAPKIIVSKDQMVKRCPGGKHAWYETKEGKVRKPIVL